MKIKWLGQGGYLLWDDCNAVCIDPYLSDCVTRLAGRKRLVPAPIAPEELKADVVICTHNHLDHVDIDAIPRMDPRITFLAPADCQGKFQELGVKLHRIFEEGDTVELGDFRLEAVHAEHTVPAIGVLVHYGDKTYYFSGDTFYHEALVGRRIDGMFICINGRLGNMNVEEAKTLTRLIQPRFAVPNHYDLLEGNTEDPRKFDLPYARILEHGKEYEIECLI
ncbi:MAG: MBL fold metallo-hydrolase [Clostridia bacterium]|nr:MBL fold metallo-hydrolase [Clostridia bacterium]